MTLLGVGAMWAAFTTGVPVVLALAIDRLIRPWRHWHAGHSADNLLGRASPPIIRPPGKITPTDAI